LRSRKSFANNFSNTHSTQTRYASLFFILSRDYPLVACWWFEFPASIPCISKELFHQLATHTVATLASAAIQWWKVDKKWQQWGVLMLQNGFLPEFQVASRYVKRYSAEMASQMCWAYAVAKANEISTAFARVFRFFGFSFAAFSSRFLLSLCRCNMSSFSRSFRTAGCRRFRKASDLKSHWNQDFIARHASVFEAGALCLVFSSQCDILVELGLSTSMALWWQTICQDLQNYLEIRSCWFKRSF